MRRLSGFLSIESITEINLRARTLGGIWCALMHASIKWPIHGRYECATCGRLYPVPWANIHGAVLAGTIARTERESEHSQFGSSVNFEAEPSTRFSRAHSSVKA